MYRDYVQIDEMVTVDQLPVLSHYSKVVRQGKWVCWLLHFRYYA
jgi:hypothetical protein